MPKFAANLSMMFTEVPFLQRFDAAAEAGFEAVEYLFPYAFAAHDIAAKLRQNRLTQALFNCPPGDWDKGEKGLASLPGREREFRDGIDKALGYAEATGCPRLHVMAGVGPHDDHTRAVYIDNLRYAAERFAERDITALIEPINTRDIPGYFLNYSRQAVEIIDAVGADNLGLQLDLYHCQIMEGDLAEHLRGLKNVTRHIQIAGVPGRHEPDIGEINYPYLFELMDALGYDVWVGCEYRPEGETTAGLGWYSHYR